MQLKINVRKLTDGIVVVDLAGRLVFGEETAALRDQVKSLIAQDGKLVLSLADVTYIDSGGLGTLVALYTTARVARVLHRSCGLPWQRVLGAGGEIKLRGDHAIEQRLRLEAEGVRFCGRRVDMKAHEFGFER